MVRTKVAMMQPAFFPWQGFFELILNSDKFIFLDDFQFSVQSHHTRNKLFVGKNQVNYYTVPIQKSKSFEQPLNEVLIVENNQWKNKLLRTLEYNYQKAPYFKEIYDKISSTINQNFCSLAELNIALIKDLCLVLNIKKDFLYSSNFSKETNSNSTRSKRVLELLNWSNATEYLSAFGSFNYMKEDDFDYKNIHVIFQNYQPMPYRQIHSVDFVPYLSILDALFNIGPKETLSLIQNGTTKWLEWNERNAILEKEVYNNDK